MTFKNINGFNYRWKILQNCFFVQIIESSLLWIWLAIENSPNSKNQRGVYSDWEWWVFSWIHHVSEADLLWFCSASFCITMFIIATFLSLSIIRKNIMGSSLQAGWASPNQAIRKMAPLKRPSCQSLHKKRSSYHAGQSLHHSREQTHQNSIILPTVAWKMLALFREISAPNFKTNKKGKVDAITLVWIQSKFAVGSSPEHHADKHWHFWSEKRVYLCKSFICTTELAVGCYWKKYYSNSIILEEYLATLRILPCRNIPQSAQRPPLLCPPITDQKIKESPAATRTVRKDNGRLHLQCCEGGSLKGFRQWSANWSRRN